MLNILILRYPIDVLIWSFVTFSVAVAAIIYQEPQVWTKSHELFAFLFWSRNFSCWNHGVIPYTRVNKCMRLFQKLQGNMRLIPNMRLIMKSKKLTTPPKRDATCTWQCTRRQVKEPESSSCWVDVHRGISNECELWCHNKCCFLSWWEQLM